MSNHSCNKSSWYNLKFILNKKISKQKKKGVALLDHKYVYNAALNGCASPINIISFQT